MVVGHRAAAKAACDGVETPHARFPCRIDTLVFAPRPRVQVETELGIRKRFDDAGINFSNGIRRYLTEDIRQRNDPVAQFVKVAGVFLHDTGIPPVAVRVAERHRKVHDEPFVMQRAYLRQILDDAFGTVHAGVQVALKEGGGDGEGEEEVVDLRVEC